jgi:hypothetical protein
MSNADLHSPAAAGADPNSPWAASADPGSPLTADGRTTIPTPSSPAPSAEEAAAIVAALERFMRATAPATSGTSVQVSDGWRRAAILEGISREPQADVLDPWINT